MRVRLTPRGGADRIDAAARDQAGPYLRARVRAAPEHGQANAALAGLLARELGVAKSQVRLARGAKARIKTLAIEGIGEAEVAALLARYAEAKP